MACPMPRLGACFFIIISVGLLIDFSWQMPQAPPSANLQVLKQWKLFDWEFLPHHATGDMNFYNPNNILATGLAIGRNRIFVATPKLFSGVPSTLNVIDKTHFGDSPPLKAYPDWSFSNTGRTDFNCSDLILTSVYRIRIDSCNRLWVLDAGVSRSLEDYEVTCPPKLLVIDLNTDQVVRRIDFPRQILRGESLFTNLVVDETTAVAGTCDDVYVYITDTVEPGIIVYDSQRDVTWRLSHPSMYPDPDFAQSRIHRDEFVLMDGVVGMAFDAKRGIVYYQPLATDRIFSVTREVLRAGPLAQNEQLDVKLVGKKSSQGVGLGVAPRDGSLIFSPLTETAVASWNPASNKQAVLAYDAEQLQFVADMSMAAFDKDAIYAVSSKFHRFFLKNLNREEINNRIVRIPLGGGAEHGGGALHGFEAFGPPSSHLSVFQAPFQFGSKKAAAPPLINYFGSASAATGYQQHQSRHHQVGGGGGGIGGKSPYAFEPLNIINYSLNNPFASLNHGESLVVGANRRVGYDYKSKGHATY